MDFVGDNYINAVSLFIETMFERKNIKMREKVLKTALIGAGGIGRGFHLRNIVSNDGYKLAAIVDTNKAMLSELGEKHNVPTYTDMTKMLTEVKPELCVIATPTYLHVPQAIKCMEVGCDVFLEKPMGMNLLEAQKLSSRRYELGRKLMIYQPHRTRIETLAAEKIIADGKLGEIFMIKRSVTDFFLRDHWQGYKKNGGGNLANHGSHYIDQLLHLSGGCAVKAGCVLKHVITTGDADDVAKAVIVTDNNITLDLDINFVSAYDFNGLTIFGENGTADLIRNEQGKFVYRIRYYDPKEHDGDNKKFPFKEEVFNAYELSPIDFYEKCYEFYALDRPQFVPVEETLKVMEAIDICRAASGEY